MTKACCAVLLLLLSVSVWAGEPKEKDYPMNFIVQASGTSRSQSLYVLDYCWMRLQSGSTVYVVHASACFRPGDTVYHGKVSHGYVELLWNNGKKWKVARYFIDEQLFGQ